LVGASVLLLLLLVLLALLLLLGCRIALAHNRHVSGGAVAAEADAAADTGGGEWRSSCWGNVKLALRHRTGVPALHRQCCR
jgi:hypothetical protein